ncbi:MAG: hypothetical protein RBU27_05210 [Bacteroidota bacterium]|nr:hypothetical protein [Bacteroidota bacterium]
MATQTVHTRFPVAYALAITAVVIAATLFGGCSEPMAPVLPRWDIDASVPLINKTYTMGDLMTEDDMMRITQDGDQVLIVSQRFPVEAISLAQHLTLDDHEFRTAESFNTVRFEIPEYLDQHLNVFTLFPSLSGGTHAVAPTRNDLGVTILLDAREYFEELTFARGTLALRFTNGTPVPIGLEDIRLLAGNGATIRQAGNAGTVQPGQTITLPPLPLDGVTLRSDMRLGFDVTTPGSGGTAVNLGSAHSLGVQGTLTDTDILSVRGFLPAQQLVSTHSVDITDGNGVRIRDGRVHSGSLRFTLKNHFNIGADLTLTVPSVTRDGIPVAVTARVAPKASKTVNIDLAGAAVQLTGETRITYETRIITDDATTTAVTMHRGDSIAVTGALRDVALASMTGTLAPRSMRVRKMKYSDPGLDKSITGAIRLEDARMWVEMRNDAQLPVGVSSAAVLGKNAGGTSATMRVDPFDMAGQSHTTIHFDNSLVKGFLNSFATNYPDSLGIEGEFVLNPTQEYGSARRDDQLTGDVCVEFPLRFTQLAGTVTDTVALDISDDTRKKLVEVNEGTLSFDLENHLPTDVVIEPEFLDSRFRPLFAPVATDGQPLRVGAAPVDGEGFVRQSTLARVSMHFSGEDFAKLAKATSIRFRLSFNARTSSGTFRSSDYVRVRGGAVLNVSTEITEK